MKQGNQKGRVMLLTGATAGMGEATAHALAATGATVVLACRDKRKGEALQRELQQETGNPNIDVLELDLASQASIRRAAAAFTSKYDKLHVLINCAGLQKKERELTEDGLETTFAVNHLGPFLLTNLLLDTLRASAPSRIVNYASSIQNPIPMDDLQSEKSFKPFQVYGRTKMANILFTYELARRLEGTGVTVNCLHPGVVRTELTREAKGAFKVMMKAFEPFFLTPKKGAETGIYLATSPEVEGISGAYFVKKKPVRSSMASYNRETAAALWRKSEELLGTPL